MEQYYKGYIKEDYSNTMFTEGEILRLSPIYRFSDDISCWYLNYLNDCEYIEKACEIANKYNEYFECLKKKYNKETSALLADLIKRESSLYGNNFVTCTNMTNDIGKKTKDIIEIIFEIVIDKYGNEYARELITKKTFPIIMVNFHELIYEEKADTKSKIYDKYYHFQQKLVNTNISNKLQYFLIKKDYERASTIEIDKYLQLYKRNRQKKKLAETLELYHKNNIYNEEITIEEPKIKQLLTKSKEELILENIEYLLEQLKNKNIEAYTLMQQELNNFFDQIGNLPLTSKLNELIEIETKIEMYLRTNKHNDDININSYLKQAINEYLEYFINDKDLNEEITIEQLDIISESILLRKETYNLNTIHNLNKLLTLIYILIIKADNLSEDKLENSYFKNNLKLALIIISLLQEEDIIEDEIINYYDNLNLEQILELIKKIKFKKQKIKQLSLLTEVK